MPAPREWFTKRGSLRKITDTQHLMEENLGVTIADMETEQRKEYWQLRKEIYNKWKRKEGSMRIKKENLRIRSKNVSKIGLFANTMPYFLIATGKLFKMGKKKAIPELHKDIAKEIIKQNTGKGLKSREIVQKIRAGQKGTLAIKFHIPYAAVEEVYAIPIIGKLINMYGGVGIIQLVHMTKKPEYTINTLLEMEKQGMLRPHVIAELRELGF